MKKPKKFNYKSKSISQKPGKADIRRLAQGPSTLTDYSKATPLTNPDEPPPDMMTMPGMMFR